MSTLGQDILAVAVEGGINYFATVTDMQRDDAGNYIEVTVEDAEGNGDFEPTTVKATQMEHAANAMIHPEFRLREDIKQSIRVCLRDRDAGELDATAAEVIFQQAAFGDITFG